MSYTNKEKRKQWGRQNYHKHRDEILANNKKYYQEHADKRQERNAKAREYYQKHKEEIKEYNKRNREKIKARLKEYNNLPEVKLAIKEKQRQRTQEAKDYVFQYKLTHPCIKCGESHPACLVFHHRNPDEKEYDIPRLTKHGVKAVQKEMEKCDVLCANCHTKLHWRENNGTN